MMIFCIRQSSSLSVLLEFFIKDVRGTFEYRFHHVCTVTIFVVFLLEMFALVSVPQVQTRKVQWNDVSAFADLL